MKKKALAYLGGSRQLEDFIWYYLYKGKDYDWTLVCQPMFKKMKLSEVCEKAGIFKNIIQVDSYFAQSFSELVKIGIKMGIYWITGQNKKYAVKEINKITNLEQYDLLCVSTSRGVTPGLMILASDAECIDLMEDGLGDNTDANIKFDIKRIFESKYFIAYCFAKMGYFNINGIFPLKSTKKCNRYSENPESLSKNLYKNVFQLNDMTRIDKEEYKQIVDKAFGKIENLSDAEAIVFTTPLKDFTNDYEKYNDIMMQYLRDCGYKKIVMKKHPRDMSTYKNYGMKVIEVNPMIPGEKIVEIINDQKIFFMYTPTTMRSLQAVGKEANVFVFKELQEPQYKSCFNEHFSSLGLKEQMIIEV